MWTFWIASAALAADSITYEAVTTVADGHQSPSVTFHSRVNGTLTVSLTCSGRSFSLKEAIRPGSSHTIQLSGLGLGNYRCGGQLRLDEADGAWAESPLNFEGQVLEPLDWSYGAEDVDLEAKTLVAHPSRPLKQAEIQLIGLGGAVVDRGSMDLSDPSNPRYAWSTGDEVLKLEIVGTDTHGIAGQLTLSPWSYAIPHVDVEFETGSDVIRASEEPKLEQCWSDVTAVLAKYGDVVDIELFVAGYTDTVGSRQSNQGLSDRRARSIARWFRQRGFSGPVWYQGFGEDVLAKSTPDETDEQANRRAIYLLSADKPPVGGELPRADWRPL